MKKKGLMKNDNRYVIGLIVFLVIALVVGIKSVYAYYSSDSTSTSNLIATTVGDFYSTKENNADMVIRVYKKASSTSSIYTGSYDIPTSGTINTVTCVNSANSTSVTCTKDTGTTCSYTYSSNNISLKSSVPVICSFYFA